MPYRILVADDEADIVHISATFLSMKGYEVLAAYGGEEALKLSGNPQI